MSKIFIPVTRPEEWQFLLADPEKQWKKGYSARALAYCWIEADGFPSCIKKAFSDSGIPIFKDIEMLFVFPEYKVPLPGGVRPSQNDVFVLAKAGEDLVSITVEGKVSEPFGKIVSEWRKDESHGKEKRLTFLCKELDLDENAVQEIRYQLLHRAASALIEAKRFKASKALMLVHSFSQTHEWFDDYSAFASLFGIETTLDKVHFAKKIDDVDLYLAWVTGEKKYLSK